MEMGLRGGRASSKASLSGEKSDRFRFRKLRTSNSAVHRATQRNCCPAEKIELAPQHQAGRLEQVVGIGTISHHGQNVTVELSLIEGQQLTEHFVLLLLVHTSTPVASHTAARPYPRTRPSFGLTYPAADLKPKIFGELSRRATHLLSYPTTGPVEHFFCWNLAVSPSEHRPCGGDRDGVAVPGAFFKHRAT